MGMLNLLKNSTKDETYLTTKQKLVNDNFEINEMTLTRTLDDEYGSFRVLVKKETEELYSFAGVIFLMDDYDNDYAWGVDTDKKYSLIELFKEFCWETELFFDRLFDND